MNPPALSIIMRSFNEAWALRDTLPAVAGQDFRDWELIVIDSGSSDGSQDLIRAAQPAHFIQIEPHEYNPGRVMNRGLRLARAERCIFLNADATPQHPEWLGRLSAPLLEPKVAAVFGRQIPRTDCEAVYACDYDRCFGPERESARWDHFFSMVSSGLRKDVWAQRGFDEALQLSEDAEYTLWCRQQGYQVRYVPDAVVMHSHNYTLPQAYKRAFGMARDIGYGWQGGAGAWNWPRTVLLGTLSDLRHDVRFCVRQGRLRELPHAARVRWRQRTARLAGFRQGLAERRTQAA